MMQELTRRRFNQSIAALGAAAALPAATQAQDHLLEWQRDALAVALDKADKKFNPELNLLRSTTGSIGYHTTFKAGVPVHQTRGSAMYAAALLDSGDDKRLARAQDILRTIIGLQDQNPENRTYGIWSWYYEEPLDMMSPPDWNWADFIGVQLLHCWLHHRDRLDDDLREALKDSILHACRSIKKRNVGPGYTNIAIMGTYVTLISGEQFDLDEFRDYGKQRLRRFYDATADTGSFNEYNSPTYTMVAIAEITRMMMHAQDPDDREIIKKLNAIAWTHTSKRFHPPTRQWAGPHSRSYRTLLNSDSDVYQIVEIATGQTGQIYSDRPFDIGLDDYRLRFECPKENLDSFLKLDEPKQIVEVFQKRERGDVAGTTWLHPDYCLGSVNYGDFWVQRRPIIAYWGSADQPRYLQVRFLHDGYDYCSAIPFTMQRKGSLMCHVNFATDYGDTHVSLDRIKDATIQAKDLRLRFEFGGHVDNLNLKMVGSPRRPSVFTAQDEPLYIQITNRGGVFDTEDWMWETGEGDGKKWVDAIAWRRDEEQALHLDRLTGAVLAFGLTIRSAGERPEGKGNRTEMGAGPGVVSTMQFENETLKLGTPQYPNTLRELQEKAEFEILNTEG